MKVECKKIKLALDIAIGEGNEIVDVEVGWSKAKKVYKLKKPLEEHVKKIIINNEPDLIFCEFEGSLYDPAESAFQCRECTLTISFPVKKNIYARKY